MRTWESASRNRASKRPTSKCAIVEVFWVCRLNRVKTEKWQMYDAWMRVNWQTRFKKGTPAVNIFSSSIRVWLLIARNFHAKNMLSLSPSGCINPSLGGTTATWISFSISLCHQHPPVWGEARPGPAALYQTISSLDVLDPDDHTLQLSWSFRHSYHLLFAARAPTIAVLLSLSCLWYKRLQLLVEYLHFFSYL